MGVTRVIPLGGLGEIGLNALVLEAEDELILVDCGLMVPPPEYPGIDYLIPDLSYVLDRRTKLRAIFLTHGHDDHTGAVPQLVREIPVPIYGTPFTLELLEGRLKEVAPLGRKLLRPVALGEGTSVGPFWVEFLKVTHSVPDSAAVGIESPGGTLVCTGDFKFDSAPVDGVPSDEAGFARWGARGVDLLCCDSTNAARPGCTASERSVADGFRRLFPGVAGRAYVATFASHVHRMQQVIETSREVGRSVAFLGRSAAANARAARRLGHLRTAPGDVVPLARAVSLPRERLTVILGGAQGEPGSALHRVIHGAERLLRLSAGDGVFLSARTIPGHERDVGRLLDLCVKQGARVHAGEQAGIHVSGHPCSEDVRRMLDLVRPKYVIPVHGGPQHRGALAVVAEQWGLSGDRILRPENGDAVVLENGRATQGPRCRAGRAFVMPGGIGLDGDALLKDRRRLGAAGVVVASAAVTVDGSLAWGPNVRTRGVFPESSDAQGAAEAAAEVRRQLAGRNLEELGPTGLEAEMMAALRRHFRRTHGDAPIVIAEVLELPPELDRLGGEAGPALLDARVHKRDRS